jgi:acyl-CoA carboxylase subunit beta
MLAAMIEEWDTDLRSGDPLGFPGYADRVAAMETESVRTGLADGFVLIECDFDVIGGSMGLVHGEKVVRAFDRATERALPVVVVTRSGGARMQEGMLSLIQLSRTAAAVGRHQAAGLLSIAVHRSPTTGGVFASYGSLVDLHVAEAGATIGFAGPRVVEQTTGAAVDGGSHLAESALTSHLVDAVVAPGEALGWVRVALGVADAPLVVPRPPVPTRQADAPEGDGADPAWAAVRRARRLGRPSGCPRGRGRMHLVDGARPGDRSLRCARRWPASQGAGPWWSPWTATPATANPARRVRRSRAGASRWPVGWASRW